MPGKRRGALIRKEAPQDSRQRAAVYTRVSTLDQAQSGYSLAAQARQLQAFAVEQGWQVADAHVYIETGSGVRWDLPELTHMLRAAKRGEFNRLVVYDI